MAPEEEEEEEVNITDIDHVKAIDPYRAVNEAAEELVRSAFHNLFTNLVDGPAVPHPDAAEKFRRCLGLVGRAHELATRALDDILGGKK